MTHAGETSRVDHLLLMAFLFGTGGLLRCDEAESARPDLAGLDLISKCGVSGGADKGREKEGQARWEGRGGVVEWSLSR